MIYYSAKFKLHTLLSIYAHSVLFSARNKDQKLVGRFVKIGYFIGYKLLLHWKCLGNMADQNRFWSAKCRNWSENGQWPTVISSTAI